MLPAADHADHGPTSTLGESHLSHDALGLRRALQASTSCRKTSLGITLPLNFQGVDAIQSLTVASSGYLDLAQGFMRAGDVIVSVAGTRLLALLAAYGHYWFYKGCR